MYHESTFIYSIWNQINSTLKLYNSFNSHHWIITLYLSSHFCIYNIFLTGWFEQFLLCFSIYKNASKLFKTDLPKGSLSSVHGIRFISMTWVILGHTYIFGMSVWSKIFLYSSFCIFKIFNVELNVSLFFIQFKTNPIL